MIIDEITKKIYFSSKEELRYFLKKNNPNISSSCYIVKVMDNSPDILYEYEKEWGCNRIYKIEEDKFLLYEYRDIMEGYAPQELNLQQVANYLWERRENIIYNCCRNYCNEFPVFSIVYGYIKLYRYIKLK